MNIVICVIYICFHWNLLYVCFYDVEINELNLIELN